MKTIRLLLLFMIFFPVCLAQTLQPTTTGYAPVNGLQLYYETYGQGDPIVLLHGSFMDIHSNFNELIPLLAKEHRVIALDMQGHGKTADIARTISFPALASDVAGLLRFLKIDSASVLGYSLGATVALEVAIQHPAVVKKVIFISSAYSNDGWIKPAQDAMSGLSVEMLSQTPLRDIYNSLAPDTAHWSTFVGNMLKFENTPFDLGIENIRHMKAPICIIKGDNDGIDYGHTAMLYTACGGNVFADMQGLPKSILAVLPGNGHVSVIMQTKQLSDIILPFLQ